MKHEGLFLRVELLPRPVFERIETELTFVRDRKTQN